MFLYIFNAEELLLLVLIHHSLNATRDGNIVVEIYIR